MARSRSTFLCAECGHAHPKWAGRCDGCGAWNSVAEEPATVSAATPSARRAAARRSVPKPQRLRDLDAGVLDRWSTGLPELDFVLGGGLVPGSMTLLGGEPGIGKSTLLLQAAGWLESRGRPVLYASGEESPEQLRLRSERLGGQVGAVHVVGETALEQVLTAATALGAAVVVVDSIQTLYTDLLEGAPGNVGQVRECAGQLMRFAKATGIAVIVVGHVTKGGGIAGPRTLEHIVDTVLYFEGERTLDYRLLRATKNRFGSVDELGVFTMTAGGLVPVANPSEIFLASRASGIAGSAVTALMEGSRPLLVEVQALASRSDYGTPQRVTTGLDPRRLAVILAVLERRAATSFQGLDVFVQATGGVRLTEPSSDLAVAAALISSLHNVATPADVIFLGEIGLGGEVRPAAAVERRAAEAVRLGFRRVFTSSRSATAGNSELVGLDSLDDLVRALAA